MFASCGLQRGEGSSGGPLFDGAWVSTHSSTWTFSTQHILMRICIAALELSPEHDVCVLSDRTAMALFIS